MLKREVKRKAKRTFTIVASIIGGILIIILLIVASKIVLPLINLDSNAQTNGKMINPIGATSNISEIRSRLSAKNLILDSLTESSMSGVIVGQIKDGPTVYFSKNKDSNWQIQSLVLLMGRSTPDNKKPTFVDLRYSQPIVKF